MQYQTKNSHKDDKCKRDATRYDEDCEKIYLGKKNKVLKYFVEIDTFKLVICEKLIQNAIINVLNTSRQNALRINVTYTIMNSVENLIICSTEELIYSRVDI